MGAATSQLANLLTFKSIIIVPHHGCMLFTVRALHFKCVSLRGESSNLASFTIQHKRDVYKRQTHTYSLSLSLSIPPHTHRTCSLQPCHCQKFTPFKRIVLITEKVFFLLLTFNTFEYGVTFLEIKMENLH